jgi:pyruvate,orthophosphate dikinase
MTKGNYVYSFGGGKAEGSKEMRGLLGGKGAGLAEMTNIGIPVPPGFTITTEACVFYFRNDRKYPEGLEDEIATALAGLEKEMGREFGSPDNPLLVSVRSGGPVSMPGMMDTVLNIGLNDETVVGLAAAMGDERAAWDSYRRFVQMYGDVVLGLKPESDAEVDPFELIIEEVKKKRGVKYDVDLSVDDLKWLVSASKSAVRDKAGEEFPNDPLEQLRGAINAVFDSWDNPRAVAYRQINGIPDDAGTGVNVQAMVFGNTGADSGTGVAFTRSPADGEFEFYGEYLINAQGEDVVAGKRTPNPISKLKEEKPAIYEQLADAATELETHFRDIQDIEFTFEKGRLWLLQTRNGKRTGLAALVIATDMVEEGLITRDEALMMMEPDQLNQLLQPMFDPKAKADAVADGRVIARGLNAGPGAASGRVVFSASRAETMAREAEGRADGGEPEGVILVRLETSADDIKGMKASVGILTARGGMTSHAALVARQMGKVCVAGCEDLEVDYGKRKFEANGTVVKEGDWLSIDGTTGEVILGRLPTNPSEIVQVFIEETMKPEDSGLFHKFTEYMGWADERRRMKVRTNADQPDQSLTAVRFGAEGIGLCRTEHMFFGGDRIDAVRRMILADTAEERRAALAEIEPMQREDFIGIFEVMAGRPVTVRTLDPPLHEFLPHDDEEIAELADDMGVSLEKLKGEVEELSEANPMLGHRGCRLGIIYPEITEMQAWAIFEAAADCVKRGIDVKPEIMIPLVGHVNELADQAGVVRRVYREVADETGVEFEYLVGTMIELPRAALTADEVAREAEFFSFGTNDLTQTCYGMSRDDSGPFLMYYVDHGILKDDPFQTVDAAGVGKLMEIGVKRGRATRPDLKVGICGEHGGDPRSIEICDRLGLDYVSCSPYRVPIARLAAAQATIKSEGGGKVFLQAGPGFERKMYAF